MPDYPALYQRLWREIQKQDGRLTDSTGRFVAGLVRQLRAEGWQISADAEQALNDYLTGIGESVKSGIQTAVTVAAAGGVLQSDAVLKLTEQAFVKRWPDGLTLSERLWRLNNDTRQGLTDVLQQGARQGQAVDRIVMAMQRTVERSHAGQRFKIISEHQDDWVKNLHQAAQEMIHNPEGNAAWNEVVARVEDKILSLSKTGSRTAAEQVLKKIREAVDKGREDLLDKAVKWWVYDKQLYNLKRIARTEMSTAMHRAVIASTEADSDIIGYQWRLSSSHPRPDICDYYASVEMGLGKGVWSKEAVPDEKAHPHCMCLLIPRVSKIKARGHGDFRSFMENLQPEQQAKLLPRWAKNLVALGQDVNDLVRPDGLWLKSRKQFIAKVGEDKFKAGQAIGSALTEKKWPENRLKPRMRMTRDTLAAIKAADTTEGRSFLRKLERDNYRVNSLEWHYFRYKYFYKDPLKNPDQLNRRMDAVLQDKQARVFHPDNKRYVIISSAAERLAVVEHPGHRISVRQYDKTDLEKYQSELWLIDDLVK
jgi:hypothetical protein